MCLVGLTGSVLLAVPPLNLRLPVRRAGWLLSLFPAGSSVLILSRLPSLSAVSPQSFKLDWIPSLGLTAGLYFDHLSALFGLLITGIGTLVVIYAGYYFDQSASSRSTISPWREWRFLAFLFLFMAAMVTVVMAGDVLTLFISWELTSVASFLLIGYRQQDQAARQGAFKSLLITGAGGVALLLGLLVLSSVTGSGEFAHILTAGDLVRSSPLYLLALALVALGAFTKSAQFPFHIWLPDAMGAPTPASAYLHSATMVKAGIFLLARLNPVLGFTDEWFWLLTAVGGITMLTGASAGFRQNDLKALLAYSTISQLGVLIMLIGQDTEIAFKALVISILAHALYKSALFMLVGIVDHATGTRDLRRLGGLVRTMPIAFLATGVAAMSMAGLPPLFGFLAKETLLATATHPNVPPLANVVLPATTVIAGALILAQAGVVVWDSFLGRPRDQSLHPHRPPAFMCLVATVPAVLSLTIGLLPEPEPIASFLANAAAAVYGSKVKVSLALWNGITVPLLLSAVAVCSGMVLFVLRHPLRERLSRTDPRWSANTLYRWSVGLIDGSAFVATRLQGGKLRTYMATVILGMLALVFGFGDLAQWHWETPLTLPTLDTTGEIVVLRIFALLVVVTGAAATIGLPRDFWAVVALGSSGMAVAILMVLEPAPDVALVQLVADILTVVILVLALARLPRSQRQRANDLMFLQSRASLVRDSLIAVAAGAVVALVTLVGLTSRPRTSAVTPYYEDTAKVLAGTKDIVGAILVDYRALDTLIEIAVFGLAGLGVYTLLRHASVKAGDHNESDATDRQSIAGAQDVFGIAGAETSSFVHALAYVSLPLAMVIGLVHIMYGHDQPGDGFTAGVIISLAIGFWYVVFGFRQVRRQLTWLRSAPLIATGLLLAIASGTAAACHTGSFLGHVDWGEVIGISLPRGFALSTSFLFEVAICLTVLGSASYILDTLGRPGATEHESAGK
jgi:NADH:ubiquinone oxidoreductase subunit 5 (subunit L)/multisubunit Na+/H+ antiporter MnhA subunit/multisubunit Na+/H+ antiporter MnhB subunit